MRKQVPSTHIDRANTLKPGKASGTGLLQLQINASARQGAQRQWVSIIQQPAQRKGIAEAVTQRNIFSFFGRCFKSEVEKDMKLTATTAEEAARTGAIFLGGGPESPEFRKISAMMCWDAVAYCGFVGGVNSKYNSRESGKDNKGVIETSASIVTDSSTIPRGHIIGFFEDKKLIHVMLSLGNQNAAGTKSGCLWNDDSGAWNNRKLPAVDGVTGKFDDDAKRKITMRHKAF